MDYRKIPILGPIIGWMDGNDIDYGPFVAIISLSLLLLGLFLFGVSVGQVLSLMFAFAPIWLPIFLFFLFFFIWMYAIGIKFWLSQGRTTLRIKLPQEISKSPEAMEIVISQIHNVANPDNLQQTYLDGKRPLPVSFELASLGGEVSFYVNLPSKKTRPAFESNMYAQYPGIEIIEEPVDYAAEIPLDTENHQLMSFHMGKKSDQEFPIKTYIDYGLDKMPDEEEKNDPITPMLEVLANIRPDERLYVQIIATAHREHSFENGQLVKKPKWDGGVQEKISEIMQRDPKSRKPLTDEQNESDNMPPRITPGERDMIEAMERNVGKYAFETGIRWMYVAPNGAFDADRINPMIRTFSQYDKIGRNQIGVRWRTDFNYKGISDPSGKKLKKMKREELKEFKLRKYVNKNGKADSKKIFTSEELATMFHLPGSVALTPGLGRIPSTRSEAPPNLPTSNETQ